MNTSCKRVKTKVQALQFIVKQATDGEQTIDTQRLHNLIMRIRPLVSAVKLTLAFCKKGQIDYPSRKPPEKDSDKVMQFINMASFYLSRMNELLLSLVSAIPKNMNGEDAEAYLRGLRIIAQIKGIEQCIATV